MNIKDKIITLNVEIADRHAVYVEAPAKLVCGNPFKVIFHFDEEWTEFANTPKKAKLVFWRRGKLEHLTVEFTGNVCSVPALFSIKSFEIGVYIDNEDICTTTGAVIECEKSIHCNTSQSVLGPDVIENINAALKGEDGKTPYIGENGNWWIGDVDTGTLAKYVNVVQTTGNSTEDVMSQDATTRALNEKANNSDMEQVRERLDKLEYVATGKLYSDVESRGVGKEVQLPSGVLPYGSITSIGGMSYIRVRNLIPFPYRLSTMTAYYNGLFRTVNNDSSFTVIGTSAADMQWWFRTYADRWTAEWGKKYFFSGCPQNGSENTFYLQLNVLNNSGATVQKFYDYGEGVEVDTSNIPDGKYFTFALTIKKGVVFNGEVFKPQFELGTITEFEPYTVKPTAVKYITVRGRNRAVLEPYGSGAEVELGSNYFKVKKSSGGSYNASMYINGLTPGDTYTIYLKTDIPPDQYNMYPNLSLNDVSQSRFNNQSIYRLVFRARDNGKRDRMTVYFNGANSAVATTYIEILEGNVIIPANELFAPIHEDYVYEIPEAVRNVEGYGHGVDTVGESGTICHEYNYVDFEEKTFYQSVYTRAYKTGDSSTWNYLTDGTTTVYNDSEGKITITDVGEHIPEDGIIVPIVSEDTIIFSENLGEELPCTIDYHIKYQVKT